VSFDFFCLNKCQFGAGHIEQELCRKLFFDGIDRFSTGAAMSRNYLIRINFAKLFDDPADNRLKIRAAQVKTSHYGMNLVIAGNFARVVNRIDDSGMGTAGKDNQPLPFQIHQQ
jgi:hypothetical protein